MENTQRESGRVPAVPSVPPSSTQAIDSPEFGKEAIAELKDWVEQGHRRLTGREPGGGEIAPKCENAEGDGFGMIGEATVYQSHSICDWGRIFCCEWPTRGPRDGSEAIHRTVFSATSLCSWPVIFSDCEDRKSDSHCWPE
jgi:hypothetical protein